MRLKNTEKNYGLLAILFHWITAIGVFFLFGLGLWMTSLDYYHPDYRTAPHLHKSLGVLLIGLVIMRLLWRVMNPSPQALTTHKTWEALVAKIVHAVLYILLISLFISGYLITTAEGDSLDVFSWFSLPSLIDGIKNLEDLAGEIHEWIAFTLIALVVLHALAALKHHFLDKDSTLKRMFSTGEQQ